MLIRYIVLLRGVNISGKNRIIMSILRQALLEAEFYNVKTLINSGNIVFDSRLTALEVEIHVSEIITTKFSLSIKMVVLTADELLDISKSAPAWWGTDDKTLYHNAIFLIGSITTSEILTTIGKIKPELEKLDFCEKAIFWTAKLANFNQTRGAKIASLPINNVVTIRNANTVKKILALVLAE